MLRVHPILISTVSDNDLANEVRRGVLGHWIVQLMDIRGRSCHWCSNRVNIPHRREKWPL